MTSIEDLKKAVKTVYTKLYYITEKEYTQSIEDREIVDKSVLELVDVFDNLDDMSRQQLNNVEIIYYTDIVSFWKDSERNKNKRHAWLILSEYIPSMYKEINTLNEE